MDVINNVLYEENQVGWELLQQSDVGSQALLNNAERYALFVARARKDTAENVTVSRDNIGKLMHILNLVMEKREERANTEWLVVLRAYFYTMFCVNHIFFCVIVL